MYYRGAAAAIIVYDITRANTFKTLKNWIEELRSQGPKDIAIAIAGNKADLEDQRVKLSVCLSFISLSLSLSLCVSLSLSLPLHVSISACLSSVPVFLCVSHV